MSLKGEEALVLGMNYTNESLEGGGALKGFSPTVVENPSNTAEDYRLDITDINSSYTTPNLIGPTGDKGEQGDAAPNVVITENVNNTDDIYKLDLDNGVDVFTTANIIGKQGIQGVSPTLTLNADNTEEIYKLDIKTRDSEFTTPNLRGPIGPKGEQGESAVSAINPRGDYSVDADPTYAQGDYVTHTDGNTYVCKNDNPTNVAPVDGTINDEYWQIIALRGAKGEKGEDGIDGENGTTFIPTVDAEGNLSWSNDGGLENPATIKIEGKDGTTYIPSIGTVTTVENDVDANVGVTIDEETKRAVFDFEIPKGANGEKAVQFTPSITENGELAWENDGELENPPTTPIQTMISTAPIGTVLSFAGVNAPNGYLLCDGARYAVAEYPDLYAVIGNTYGGDSENFNVPDLVDKFIQGSTTSGTEKEAGLPNIEGSIGNSADNRGFFTEANTTGAFEVVSSTLSSSAYRDATADSFYGKASFDASKSNTIYGNSDTVQPPALTMVYIIKAFHTNEGQDEGLSDDVINYVEGEIAEVENKVNEITYSTDANECIPALMKTARYNLINTSANVPNSNYSWVLTAEHIKLSTGQYYRIIQDINGTKSDGGTIKYTRVATSTDDVTWTWTDWVVDALISDTSTGDTTSTWSSSKIESALQTSKNVGLTDIVGTDYINTSSMVNRYQVVNGICYVTIEFIALQTKSLWDGVSSFFETVLPKPKVQVDFFYDGTQRLLLGNNGLIYGDITTDKRVYASFSYPIA